MDATVFEEFNAGDLERLTSMFIEDLEFNDEGGKGGGKSLQQVKEDFARVFADVPDLRREIVPESLEVHPLQGYGAMEVGEHRFGHDENGKPDCAVMKFSMVWRKVGDAWKLSRVLSYATSRGGR
jgi:ketosteroid isomerase-like protein